MYFGMNLVILIGLSFKFLYNDMFSIDLFCIYFRLFFFK